MIRRLKYPEIDFPRYEKCLENSVQKNIYARKEILDTLCESWEVLIYGDYEFVMPVPLKKKFGFRIVLMPLFCQQLGIFGAQSNEKVELLFLHFLRRNYRIMTYNFNFHNLRGQNLNGRKNYIIPKTEYPLLRKNYFKGRKSTVKMAQYLTFKELKYAEVTGFIAENFKGLEKQGDMDLFFTYIQFLDSKSMLRLFGSFKEENLTNLAVIIDDGNQYSLLGLTNKEEFKLDNGASFLIDRILKEHINGRSFDFMGGSIRGIEVFFKSFGSVLQPYPVIENSKKDLVLNIFKK